MELLKLNENDYLEKDFEFWKNYRKQLTKIIKKKTSPIEKNTKNIYYMSKEIGVKPTARYFNIQPSQVRYFVKKYIKENS